MVLGSCSAKCGWPLHVVGKTLARDSDLERLVGSGECSVAACLGVGVDIHDRLPAIVERIHGVTKSLSLCTAKKEKKHDQTHVGVCKFE